MFDPRYEYILPPDRIAYYPAEKRDESRLMLVDCENNLMSDQGKFKDVKRFFRDGDILVLNNTKVFKARLFGARRSGGKVEALLLEQNSSRVKALLKPMTRLKIGEKIKFGEFEAEFIGKTSDGIGILEFGDKSAAEVLKKCGKIPLPPYIKRPAEKIDEERYQTVIASEGDSAAAPTAGLHFTENLISELNRIGVKIVYVTLDVSYATFAPLREGQTKLHTERYKIPEDTVSALSNLSGEGRIIAVGTTVVRTLESFAMTGIKEGETDIFIRPGFDFKFVSAMITNFHLPSSSLLMLVHAFSGDIIFNAYEKALEWNFRFFSYGDCMMILR
ncbi:MAG: tRNA preQ1(34) S-adenosylmethionine ribosyltransferase-isomerase QueA [Candidatus Hydrogenedentes bacterium CG07_land_8_20_14_0_80_42_17]|nr:MAG: tRNA preQ1(34) S-adenosylmethionine ribosyltransferase-isomerase QueA [Candidatus Hydrogenedentes bacterium CG07_land_8_20_14_0_80_42_17]